MTVTNEDVRRLRRMISEPTDAVYTDSELTQLLEESAVVDVNGNEPSESDWIPTYNIYKVASELWLEKASSVADEFDFNADGGSFSRSQKQQMYLKQASYFESRSKALSLQMRQRPLTKLNASGWEDTPYNDEIDEFENNLT